METQTPGKTNNVGGEAIGPGSSDTAIKPESLPQHDHDESNAQLDPGPANTDTDIDDSAILQPTSVDGDSWSAEAKAWHSFLLKHCPTLDKASQRVLVDVKGAWAELSGTSSFNTKHVKFACSVALDAIVISCFYRAQVDLYKAELDKMASSGALSPDGRSQILACTVDSSKRLPADFTIVDFVQTRPSAFLSNPHRLRTIMNHARHATLLILSSRLFTNASHHHHKVRLLQRLYDDAASRGGVVTKHVPPHENPPNQEDNNNPQPVKIEKQTGKCKLCGKPDHGQRKCPDQVCVRCGETGHEKRDCPQQTCSDCGQLGHHNFYCPEQTCSHCFGFGHRRWRDCARSQYTRRHK